MYHLSNFGLVSYFVKIFYFNMPKINHFPLLEGAFDNYKYVLLKMCDRLKTNSVFVSFPLIDVLFCSVYYLGTRQTTLFIPYCWDKRT